MEHSQDNQKLLTLDEVSKLVGLKITTLRKWSSEGRLPFPVVRISRKAVRVQRQAVLDWIAAQTSPHPDI